MKVKQTQGMRILQQLFLRGKRIFNMAEAEAAAIRENIPHKQIKKILSNLAKYGRVLRLRRGLYVSIGLLPDQTNTHPFAISAYLIQPSAISHWSALQYHGLTEQIPQIVTAITTSKVITPSMRKTNIQQSVSKHAWEIKGIRYEYTNIQEKYFFGIEEIWIDESFRVPITDKERTLLDVFVSPKIFGGMGEALGILQNALPNIDIQKLVDYAVKYKNKSVIKRLGWALEYFNVEEKYLMPLLETQVGYYCRLDPAKPAKGPCDKRWMIQNNLIRS